MESFSFQNYKILHLIGEGSFGKVFKAAEKETDNVVALKILIKVSFSDRFGEVLFTDRRNLLFIFAARKILEGADRA